MERLLHYIGNTMKLHTKLDGYFVVPFHESNNWKCICTGRTVNDVACVDF